MESPAPIFNPQFTQFTVRSATKLTKGVLRTRAGAGAWGARSSNSASVSKRNAPSLWPSTRRSSRPKPTRAQGPLPTLVALERQPKQHRRTQRSRRRLGQQHRQLLLQKTGLPVLVHLGSEGLSLLKDLPSEGALVEWLCGGGPEEGLTDADKHCDKVLRERAQLSVGFDSGSLCVSRIETGRPSIRKCTLKD